MKNFCTLAVVAALELFGCSKHSAPTMAENLQSKNSTASATIDAGKFLRGLHEQGKLPGLSRDDHGELKGKVSDFSQKVQFPLSLTFEFTKTNGPVYHYTVEQLNSGSDWRLTKAWQTDAAGKTMTEFPLQ